MKKRILFYYYYCYGLGHIQRILIQANAIKRKNPSFDVMVINGGRPIGCFDWPKDIELIQFPVVTYGNRSIFEVAPRNISLSPKTLANLRKEMLISITESFRPNVVIVDFFPFDRRFLRSEIMPMLEHARKKSKKMKAISSTREIIGMNKLLWNTKIKRDVSRDIENYFDYVFIHGDPEIFKLDEGLSSKAKSKFIYTGYIVCKKKKRLTPRRIVHKNYNINNSFLITASVGSGKDGFSLLKNVILAEKILNIKKRHRYKFIISSGPVMSSANYNKLVTLVGNNKNISFQNFRRELIDIINASDVSISMCGNNTCAETLLTRTKSIVVPRVKWEKEQLIRARRLSELNVARMIHPNKLSPGLLAYEIKRILAGPPARHGIDLGGADFVADFVKAI